MDRDCHGEPIDKSLYDYCEICENKESDNEILRGELKKAREVINAAEKVVAYFNFGGLTGNPESLTACGDLSASIEVYKRAREYMEGAIRL